MFMYYTILILIPELVRDWLDLDFPMRDMRLGAAIQPSLDVLRLRTSLHGHTEILNCCLIIYFI